MATCPAHKIKKNSINALIEFSLKQYWWEHEMRGCGRMYPWPKSCLRRMFFSGKRTVISLHESLFLHYEGWLPFRNRTIHPASVKRRHTHTQWKSMNILRAFITHKYHWMFMAAFLLAGGSSLLSRKEFPTSVSQTASSKRIKMLLGSVGACL